MKITLTWQIKNMLKKKWTRIWLSIFALSIILYLTNFWITHLLDSAINDESKYTVDQRQFYDHWGKNRTDFQWLMNFKESRRTDIPTFVVEEHYEVVKYWFQAAELGLISKSRNLLLHIDGHFDGAFPEDAESIPWFRFPRNADEIHHMMQRNDMFIMEAALTGLIDHVIWVWPTWIAGSDQEEEYYSHAVFDIYIGYARIYSSKSGGYDNDLCACYKKHFSVNEVNEKEEWKCRRRNKTITAMEGGLTIENSECSRQADGILEIMSESLAASVLSKYQWRSTKTLLLDIDEDFFGCWSDVIPLYEVGLSQKNINVLSELVSYLFCVRTAEEEQLADRFYVSLLHLMKALKSKSCADGKFKSETKCLRNVEIENFIIDNMDGIHSFLISKGSSHLMCELGERVSGLFLQSLMHFLLNFSLRQLDALSELGICLEVSPPSIYYPTSGKFRVCHGDNIPNNTEVTFYMPEKIEINFRALKLKHILTSLTLRPDMISISRSVRDGYTPKTFFNLIEENVMKSIHSSYRQTQSDYVHYDTNLLGGKTGWSSRSQPLVHQLLDYLAIS